MNAVIEILVLADDGADEEVVSTLLSSDDELRVVGYLTGLHEHQPHADVLVIACREYGDVAAAWIRQAVDERPERPVVLLCQGAPNGYVDEAFHAGVTDLVVLPPACDAMTARALSPQVRFTLGKAVARHRQAAERSGMGRMVVVLGPKGGCGKTLVATNLAVALARAGQKVVLIDVDVQFGDVGLALGLRPQSTLYDLASSGGALDIEKLDAFLMAHSSGARVLLAPSRPDQAAAVTPDFLRELYAMLREHNDVVVVDTPPSFTPEVIGAIDSSTDACVVGMLDSLSLKNTRLGIETLELMGYDRGRVRLVLNRANSRVGIDVGDVVAILGAAPDVLVPSDREITRSINAGEPIALTARRSEAGKAFDALAALYGAQGRAPKAASKRRRRRSPARS